MFSALVSVYFSFLYRRVIVRRGFRGNLEFIVVEVRLGFRILEERWRLRCR